MYGAQLREEAGTNETVAFLFSTQPEFTFLTVSGMFIQVILYNHS